MQLVVKQGGSLVKEIHFSRGPVYIGRQPENNICLPDLSVSRQHAVFYGADETDWFVEDLDSANKTYLNKSAIHKAKVKDGDMLRIAGFTIDIRIRDADDVVSQINMSDTLKMAAHGPETIIRRFDLSDSPDIKMPTGRANDYREATAAIYTSDSAEKLLEVLTELVDKQFDTFHTWIGLRTKTDGEFVCQGGHKKTGQKVEINDLIFKSMVEEAIAEQKYVLIPLLTKDKRYERIRSALVAPLLGKGGCCGVIYADNATDQRHYSLVDMDYLILLAVQAGMVLENL